VHLGTRRGKKEKRNRLGVLKPACRGVCGKEGQWTGHPRGTIKSSESEGGEGRGEDLKTSGEGPAGRKKAGALFLGLARKGENRTLGAAKAFSRRETNRIRNRTSTRGGQALHGANAQSGTASTPLLRVANKKNETSSEQKGLVAGLTRQSPAESWKNGGREGKDPSRTGSCERGRKGDPQHPCKLPPPRFVRPSGEVEKPREKKN